MLIHNTALTMRGKSPNWLLGVLFPTTYILGGEYIYIPIKDKYVVESVTDYKTELKKRDARIYTKYLEGLSNKKLAEKVKRKEIC